MPATGTGGLVKVWAKKNVAVPHPIHTPRRTPGSDKFSNKYEYQQAATHHEGGQKLREVIPNFFVSVVGEIEKIS